MPNFRWINCFIQRVAWLGINVLAIAAANAQTPWPQITQLDSPDVFFAGNIHKVTFVYFNSSFELSVEDKRNFRALSAEKIHEASIPNEALAELFNYACGYDVQFDRQFTNQKLPAGNARLTREKGPAEYHVWHGLWSLYPTEGGFSGVPNRYHSFTRPDGKRIVPELYFCDHHYVDNQDYFSSLPFYAIQATLDQDARSKSVTPPGSEQPGAIPPATGSRLSINGEDALNEARTALSAFPHLAEDLQLRQVLLRELPFADAAWDQDAYVYEVQYSSTKKADLRRDAHALSIWVTTTGECSKITNRTWTPERQQTAAGNQLD